MRKIVERIPGGSYFLSLYKKWKFNVYYKHIKDKEALFTDYFHNRTWEEKESVSGSGSTHSYTIPLRKELPKLLQDYEVKKLLDAPCGDFNWFHLLKKDMSLTYVGGDIVKPLILQNRERFSDSTTDFIHLDITKEKLPESDLWFCRDCLIHFSDDDIGKALNIFLESEIPFILTTSYTESKGNKNIPTGGHRFLNLELPPFNFPKPIKYIDDWIEGFPVKRMGLWKREAVQKALVGYKAGEENV